MLRKKAFQTVLFLLSLLAVATLALPVSAAEPSDAPTDYDSYYAEGAKIAWDAFDRHTGDTHKAEDEAIFKTAGTFGEGYLSVNGTALDLSELFGNDGKTDYTLDLVVSMQKSTSGTLHIGALRNFAVGVNNGISATDQHPVDAGFGIVSHTYRALNKPDGTRIEFATDVGWKKVHFIGKPLGLVYAFGVSSDYTVGEDGTGTATLTLWRDSAVVQSAEIAYPVAENTKVYDSSVFTLPKTLNFDYYALRYYERALTEEEQRQNHFVDLAKWFGISLDVYETYDEDTRDALHLALREETFDTVTQSILQSIVDNFGRQKNALRIDDYITFEGFSAALYGTPALRSVYALDRAAVAALEKEGYSVTVGALIAAEKGREISDVTLTSPNTAVREVYRDGALVGTLLEETDDAFRFALTARYDGEESNAYYKENILCRAFMTLEKEGVCETYYLDAESESFGSSVSLEKLSLFLAFLGHTDAATVRCVLGQELPDLAAQYSADFLPVYQARENAKPRLHGLSDYLFASYEARAAIMTKTGISGNVYTYANASPYYQLFDRNHAERNVAAHETVTLLLQCENAASTVNYAAEMTTKLYEEILFLQNLSESAESILANVQANAETAGISTEKIAATKEIFASLMAANDRFFTDAVRDSSVLYTNMQAVEKTLAAPTEALKNLRAKLFEVNDLPAFGTNHPLSSYVILTDEENKNAALMLSSILSDKYGVFVPYYTSFPESAEYARTISLRDAESSRFAALLGDNDYLLTMQGTNALLIGKSTSDLQLAAVIFIRSLTDDALTLTESFGRDIPPLFDTELPHDLPKLTLKTAEDGGVLERFRTVLSEIPDEFAVLEPLSSADFPMSTLNTVYVAPDGSDSGSGTYRAPFRTLERALADALGKGGAQILLFGGTYRLDSALTISAMHGGSKQSPLYISAMPGEEVIFTASDTVEGKHFTPVTDESAIARLDTFKEGNHQNVYVADLAALGIENYAKTTTSGEPLFSIDGKQYNLARFPNKGETLTPLLTAGCILKQSQVTTGSSYLYTAHNSKLETQAGWKLRIDTESAYRDRIEKWTWTDGTNTAESIWLYGALYEEWHRDHYPLVIKNEEVNTQSGETDITMSSTRNCSWGIYDKLTTNTDSARTSRNGYFYNILEELDADGEWYLDHSTGLLYVYSSTGIADGAKATLVSDTHTILTVSDASNVVLNGITFAETLGRGLMISKCENVLVQNCTFRDTRNQACRIESSYNTGIVASDFSHTATTMLSVAGTGDRATMTPDRIFVQNSYFHDPIVQTAINMSGISCLISHNLFEHTTVTFSGAECILEYNDFDSGSQITYDSGPVYCSGASGPKGNHIRYNYLYNLNFSLYGIYIDDLSSDNYVYSNVVAYASSVTKSSKCVNLHNGHQNVVYNNVCVNAKDAAIRDNANYYLKYVYDTNGTAVTTYRTRYYTNDDGTQSSATKAESGGGLGYRWDSLMTSALSTYDNHGGTNSRYAERFPNLAMYMELTRTHLAAAKADPDYAWNTATVAWNLTAQSGSAYAWGNDSLYTFLMKNKDYQDIEVYLRSPAYNEYVGNIFLGCSTDIYSYTPWGLQTTNVENNYGLPATSEYFTQAMQGDLSKITQASTWQSQVPGFETIPYERFGRTALNEVELFCPIVAAEEDFDIDMSFEDLLNKQ